MAGTLRLSDETLAELHRRHVDFLLARLESDGARDLWVRALREGWAWFVTLPVSQVVRPQELSARAAAVLSERSVRTLLGPVAREAGARVVAALRESREPIGTLVPEDARRIIEELAGRSDLIPERLLREVLRQEAVEHALRDVLFDALKEFHDTVNPFFAEWGIPALLSWLPVGGSAVRASMGTLRAEFAKRQEPEMRKFLLVFSRKAATHLADGFVARGNDPSVVALRRNVVAFLYSQSPAELLAGVDEHASERIGMAAESIAAQAAAGAGLQDGLRRALEELAGEYEGATMQELLAGLGATGEPDFEAWADLAWPQVRQLLGSPVCRALLEELTGEFYASLRE